MKNIFKNNLFYPQNFFIRTNAYTDIASIIKEISEEASVLAPECFDAETKYFIYKLQYQPPYVKIPEFSEIKNLQIEAILKTRFKDEYNGYIGIDISEWIRHSEEEHFINCILALRKMSPHWKYVFFADESLNNEDIKKTVDFIKSEIWTKELNFDFFSNTKISDRLSEEMKEKHNIKLALSSQKVIKDIFGDNEKINNETISKIASDIAMYFGDIKGLLSDELVNYLSDDTYTHFIMNEKEINKLNDLIKEREAKR